MLFKTVIIDEQRLFAEAFSSLLSAADDVEVLGVGFSPADALQLVECHDPDVVLVGHCWASDTGPQTARALRARWPRLPVVALSGFSDEDRTLSSGATLFLSKRCSAAESLAAIREVVADHALGATTSVTRASHAGVESLPLTLREIQVLGLICDCLRTSEIAAKLSISSKTVDSHRKNIIDKLGIRTAAGLTRFGLRHGLASSAVDR